MNELVKQVLKKLLIIDVILVALALIAIGFWLDMLHLPGMLIAIFLTTTNAVAAILLAKSSMKGTMNDFMLRVMGGMGLRLGVMLIIIFLLFAFSNIPEFSFIISLFISYICKSVLEIIFIIKIRNQSQLLSK